jgi:integrase
MSSKKPRSERSTQRTAYKNVYARGDSLVVVVRLAHTDARGRRKEKWITFGNKRAGATARDASLFLADRQREQDQIFRGEVDERVLKVRREESRPIAKLIEEYSATLEGRGRSKRHRDYTRRYLYAWARACRVDSLRDADAAAFSTWLASERSRGVAARTLNAYRAAILAFCRWATAHGLTLSNPIQSALIERANEDADQQRPPRAMTLDQLDRLIEAAPPRRAAMYALGGYAGIRWSEMLRIRWGDVDFDHSRPTLTLRGSHTKNGRPAEVHLHARAVEALQRWRLEPWTEPFKKPEGVGNDEGDLIFGAPVAQRTWKKDLRAARIIGTPNPQDPEGSWIGEDGYTNELGESFERKCLRTTLGTALAAAGVDIQVAQRIMRHSDPKLTMRHYTKITLDPQREAISRLGARVARPGLGGAPFSSGSGVEGVADKDTASGRRVS